MAKKSGNAKTSHRCRVVLNIRIDSEERGISLGPGSVIGALEYVEMMERKFATPDMFEDVEVQNAEPQAAEGSEAD
jgi:hypothetical protein